MRGERSLLAIVHFISHILSPIFLVLLGLHWQRARASIMLTLTTSFTSSPQLRVEEKVKRHVSSTMASSASEQKISWL
jgi:hypothetical protein